ncbi:MAG: acetyl-CoA carboxylase biotin carboxyl carrier protein [Egibacteraceae bacterium]
MARQPIDDTGLDGAPDAVSVTRCDASAVLALSELRAEAERLIATLGRQMGHQVRRVSLRAGPNVVEVDWEVGAADPPPAAPQRVEAAEPAHTRVWRVLSPLVGTFYRAPSPGSASFVEVGDVVRAGQQMAIVEAMKLMNPITAEFDGRVTAIKAADGAMVEFDQVLFELETVDEDTAGPGMGER